MIKRSIFILLALLFLVLSSCSADKSVDIEEEMLREIVQYFEEPDNHLFHVEYPVSIDNDDCYTIEDLGTLYNDRTYSVETFAINPNTNNRYYWNGDSVEFQIFFTQPTFACKSSPDNRMRIESVRMNEDGPSGLHALKEMRIINLSTGSVEWNSGSYLSNCFAWSEDSRFVAAQYSGRQWTETQVIDTSDFSILSLPGIDDIREAFPGTAEPNPYVPMSLFSIVRWESPSIIVVRFEWTTTDDTSVAGEYEYDVIRKITNIKELDESRAG